MFSLWQNLLQPHNASFAGSQNVRVPRRHAGFRPGFRRRSKRMGIIQLSQIPLSRPLRKWLGNCMAEGVDGSGGAARRSPVETTGSWRYHKHAASAETQHRSSSGEKLDGPQAARLAGHDGTRLFSVCVMPPHALGAIQKAAGISMWSLLSSHPSIFGTGICTVT